jgi:flagellar biosynthetic protein FliR
MGLGFATAYDPLSSSQTPVISEFISLIGLLLFLSLNGHLIYIVTLAQSFLCHSRQCQPVRRR